MNIFGLPTLPFTCEECGNRFRLLINARACARIDKDEELAHTITKDEDALDDKAMPRMAPSERSQCSKGHCADPDCIACCKGGSRLAELREKCRTVPFDPDVTVNNVDYVDAEKWFAAKRDIDELLGILEAKDKANRGWVLRYRNCTGVIERLQRDNTYLVGQLELATESERLKR